MNSTTCVENRTGAKNQPVQIMVALAVLTALVELEYANTTLAVKPALAVPQVASVLILKLVVSHEAMLAVNAAPAPASLNLTFFVDVALI